MAAEESQNFPVSHHLRKLRYFGQSLPQPLPNLVIDYVSRRSKQNLSIHFHIYLFKKGQGKIQI